jgi:hypothetical protein
MRTNLNRMLDELGLPGLLRIDRTEQLFSDRTDLLHSASALATRCSSATTTTPVPRPGSPRPRCCASRSSTHSDRSSRAFRVRFSYCPAPRYKTRSGSLSPKT